MGAGPGGAECCTGAWVGGTAEGSGSGRGGLAHGCTLSTPSTARLDAASSLPWESRRLGDFQANPESVVPGAVWHGRG